MGSGTASQCKGATPNYTYMYMYIVYMGIIIIFLTNQIAQKDVDKSLIKPISYLLT